MHRAFTPDDVPSLIVGLTPTGQRIVTDLAAQWKADPDLSKPRKVGHAMLGAGGTKGQKLEQTGEVDSFVDGSIRRITTASIYRYLIRQAIASHQLSAPDVKVRHPKGQFQRKLRVAKPPRPRTAAELEGLRKGNAKRAAEAAARRAAKEAEATGV
jgi:hypothetical protein